MPRRLFRFWCSPSWICGIQRPFESYMHQFRILLTLPDRFKLWTLILALRASVDPAIPRKFSKGSMIDLGDWLDEQDGSAQITEVNVLKVNVLKINGFCCLVHDRKTWLGLIYPTQPGYCYSTKLLTNQLQPLQRPIKVMLNGYYGLYTHVYELLIA